MTEYKPMPMYKIRVIANACITRWTRGERTMNDIINGYNMHPVDQELVTAEIMAKQPTLDFDAK